MRLLVAAGVIRASDLEEAAKAPAVVEALTSAAMAFIAAGGVLSLAEWSDLLPSERAAFLAARRAYDAGTALMAAAARTPQGAAAVAVPIDGGEARDGMRVDDALAAVVAGARAMGPSTPGGGTPGGPPLRAWDGSP